MSETRFRWVGRPSEEELLGLPAAGTQRRNGFRPSPPRPPVRTTNPASPQPTRRPLRARELAAVAAVGVAIGVALRLAEEGLTFAPAARIAPIGAADAVVGSVALDRGQLTSLPRERPKTASHQRPAATAAVTTAGEKPSQQPSAGAVSAGPKDDEPTPSAPLAPPPTEKSEPPLLEADVPGVGSVTVEKPELPDADEVLPAAPTLPVP